MATRATYLFTGYDWYPTTCVYIHWDGYLEGAAQYFYNMAAFNNKRGGNATVFIKANADAELTGGHDVHGDTEFHYTITRNHLEIKSTHHDDECNDGEFITIYSGSLADFINEYGKNLPCKVIERNGELTIVDNN